MLQVDPAERCPQAVDVGSRGGEVGAALASPLVAQVGTVNLSALVASAAATDSTHGSIAGELR